MHVKKRRLLLLLLPLITGAFYLRSLASWRPKKVFSARGHIAKFVFSDDGKTLLILYTPSPWFPRTLAMVAITALDVENDFQPLWQRQEMLFDGGSAQFFAHDSRVLVQGEQTHIFETSTGKQLSKYDLFGNAAISPDGKYLAFRGFHKGFIYINPAYRNDSSGQKIVAQRTLGKSAQYAAAFSFSPDGKTFVVGVGDQNGSHLEFYDAQTWKLIRKWSDLQVSSAPTFNMTLYESLQWSRDGRFLLSSYNGLGKQKGVSLWRVTDGKRLAFTSTPGITAELQNKGQVLGFDKWGHVFLRKGGDFNSLGKPLFDLSKESITSIKLSPDGSYLLAGTQSGRVYWQRVN